MQFSFVSAAVLAFASAVVGQEYFDAFSTPSRDQILPAGVAFPIKWNPLAVQGTIKITLLEGKTNVTLQPGPIIASGVNNQAGQFTWTPVDRGFETYGFFLEDEADSSKTQYSEPFHIQGNGASSASSGSGSSTTTLKLSTGPSYTSSPSSTSTTTSSVPSSTVTVVSTSSSSTSANSTTVKPTTHAPTFAPSSPPSNITTATSFSTAITTAKPTQTLSSTASSTTSVIPVTQNAAVANLARGGLTVVGGLVLALAL